MRISKRESRVFHVPNDPDKGWVKIKHLKINETKKIEETVNNLTYGTDDLSVEMKPYERVSRFAYECLTDWGNFFDVLGKPIPFDKKMIETVAEFEIITVNEDGKEEITSLFEWIDECRETFAEQIRADKKAAVKNLKP